jgi:hypothetical protein
MAVAFADYVTENMWHPQAKILYDRFQIIFPHLRKFWSSQSAAGKVSAFIDSLSEAIEKLTRLERPCIVLIALRGALDEEIAWSEGFKGPRDCLALG